MGRLNEGYRIMNSKSPSDQPGLSEMRKRKSQDQDGSP
jgi:hypothetical protein